MNTLPVSDPLAVSVVQAIRAGDVAALERLLHGHPDLARTGIVEEGNRRGTRSLLHVATDWPGHFPHVAKTIVILVTAGADVNAPFVGFHSETPLHWAASANDRDAIDALLDAGADIEARGGVIGGGTALADAVAFGQWEAARRLLERGARPTFVEAAALGLMDRIEQRFADSPPDEDELNRAFWYACHGGQRRAAEYLLDRGADVNWVPPWEKKTPLDAARRHHFSEVVDWLTSRGGRSA
jgi:ankyrin repeat protein